MLKRNKYLLSALFVVLAAAVIAAVYSQSVGIDNIPVLSQLSGKAPEMRSVPPGGFPNPTTTPLPAKPEQPETIAQPTERPVATPDPTPVPTTEPTVTPQPTPVPTPQPTATPTPTPTPTITPTPTSTPTPTPQPTPTPAPATNIREISSMSEVDSALGSGPVVLELFTTTCQYCAQQEQILKSLSTQYPGVTFLKVNAYTSGFGGQFNAQRGVPQLHVYVKKSGSSYVYIGPNGQTSTDPMASSIIGLTGASTLSGLIDAAIAAR